MEIDPAIQSMVDPAISSMSDPAITSMSDPAIVAATEKPQESKPKDLMNPEDGVLHNSYTLFAMNNASGWDAKNIKPLANFSTIDQFWAMYQHMKRPSAMPDGTTINLFIKGIKPVWEVKEHEHGGSWRLPIAKGYANQLWEDLILAFIGEQFELADEITGIVLSVGGSSDKISIWMRNGNQPQVVQKVQAEMIRVLNLPQDVKMNFQLFHQVKESIERKNSQVTAPKPERKLEKYQNEA